jgi:hypothetical protein|tara:strand:+ start:430 stop:621 length:192 start_codon:yes stop_codon:yes gene_type:complete
MSIYTIKGTGWPTIEKHDLDGIYATATYMFDNFTPPCTIVKPDGSEQVFNTIDELKTFVEENK